MVGDSPVNWLMFFTLVGGLAIITGAFLMFLRSQRNRDIAAHTLAGTDNRHTVKSGGALPDLLALGVFAVIAMGLLGFGYNGSTHASATQTGNPTASTAVPAKVGGNTGNGQTVGANSGNAQAVGSADEPKKYQPANPAPDPRVAPAGSSAGSGPDSGGRPEQQK